MPDRKPARTCAFTTLVCWLITPQPRSYQRVSLGLPPSLTQQRHNSRRHNDPDIPRVRWLFEKITSVSPPLPTAQLETPSRQFQHEAAWFTHAPEHFSLGGYLAPLPSFRQESCEEQLDRSSSPSTVAEPMKALYIRRLWVSIPDFRPVWCCLAYQAVSRFRAGRDGPSNCANKAVGSYCGKH